MYNRKKYLKYKIKYLQLRSKLEGGSNSSYELDSLRNELAKCLDREVHSYISQYMSGPDKNKQDFEFFKKQHEEDTKNINITGNPIPASITRAILLQTRANNLRKQMVDKDTDNYRMDY